jgi:hypothetical protein
MNPRNATVRSKALRGDLLKALSAISLAFGLGFFLLVLGCLAAGAGKEVAQRSLSHRLERQFSEVRGELIKP